MGPAKTRQLINDDECEYSHVTQPLIHLYKKGKQKLIVQLLFHMYFILREEDTVLERWKAGLISSSSKKKKKKIPGQKRRRGQA